MPIINSPDDWWSAVDVHWEGLKDHIFNQMIQTYPAYEIPGNKDSKPTGNTIHEEIEILRIKRDRRLARYFHATWGLASDYYAQDHRDIAWLALCDLCSEEWVFEE